MTPHFLLSAETRFSAAHTLPGVEACERMHGHDWRVRLTVRVERGSMKHSDLAVDFRVLEEVARASVADLDHRYLNDLPPFAGRGATAERVAEVVYERACSRLAGTAPEARLSEVAVWETPEYEVVYRPA
ncbi:MAG TPA: 6-carboxytetrahydropterin synthase [Gemmatimonadales bacterium]